MAKEALRYGDVEALPDAGGEDELDLRGVARALWRRKFLLLLTSLLITGAAALYVSTLTPLYSATTLLRIETRQQNVVGTSVENVVEGIEADPATIESEIEFLKSRAFAHRVVEQVGLVQDPEFNRALQPPKESWLDYLSPTRYVPASWLNAFTSEDAATEERASTLLTQLDPRETALRNTVSGFVGRVEPVQVGRSYVIALKISSESPVKAARLANAVADTYLVAQLEQKYETSRQATRWLGQRVEELRGKVVLSETKVAQYRASEGLSERTENSPVFIQLSQINTSMAMASAERAEAEARLNQVQGLLNSSGGIAAASKVLTSPLLADLRTQEATLVRRLAEISTVYGARHPLMVNIRAEIGSLRGKMDEEVQRIVSDQQNSVAVALARETELQSQITALQGQVSSQGAASVELNSLVREAESNRTLFSTFLNRYNEIVQQQEIQQADVKVLSPAEAPTSPSFPQTKIFVAIAFAGSLVIGLLLVFVIERWDNDFGFRSADEVLSATGIRALALVPDIGKKETQGIAAEEYILQKPNSAFSEALQRVRTSLFLAQDGEAQTKTVLVTSSVPLEGKSLISCSLARQSARSGLRTLLIDADLRRPRLHEVVRVANQNGLCEVLNGRIAATDAVRADEKSGMHFMPAGTGAASPPDLLRSEAMRRLIAELREQYDLVIVDSPPVAAVSDSYILSGIVDKTVYVVRWETTPRNVALHSMRQIVEAGANIAGVVISRVNIRKHARYGYADSGYYAGYYRKYYVN